jgi:hypothetical protein
MEEMPPAETFATAYQTTRYYNLDANGFAEPVTRSTSTERLKLANLFLPVLRNDSYEVLMQWKWLPQI